MFQNLKHKLTIVTGNALININDAREMDAGKRLISIIVGAYIFQRGIKLAFHSPVMGIQELLIGGFLLYNGATGINTLARIKPKEISQIRKNQIQGNDPDSIPAFI
ncbi:putative membrane protein [Pedobacter sp. CG_S7]|uniref:hypothetical protein n=1 Tax=Pedobacter sp. CG_S7 TaxID=3143930 RepID=UPI00339AD9F7